MSEYMYTQRMERLFDKTNNNLMPFISREAVAQARGDVLFHHGSREDLERLCAALNKDADALLKDESLLQTIPTREMLKKEMAQAMYDMYRQFPTSVDYMKRMVARLAPEYAGDPLRVAILKKFLAGYTHDGDLFVTGKIFDSVYAHLPENERAQADALRGEARRKWLIDRVTDNVFDNLDTSLNPQRMLELMVRRWRHCMEHPESCFMRLENGNKAAVQDMALGSDVYAGLLACWQAHMGGAERPRGVIDSLEQILKACADGTVPKEALDMFYTPLAEDFYAQLSRMAYVNANAADRRKKIGQQYAQKSAELCHEKKYGVNTQEEYLKRWFYAIWEDHAGVLDRMAVLTDENREDLWKALVARAEDACLSGPIHTNCLEKSMKSLSKKLADLLIQHARKALSSMNEPMRTRFKTDRKDAFKSIAKDWELLKIADDLGSGKLRKSGVMKIYLYYFAFMFGMNAALLDGEKVDPVRDIDKNLFHDYYSDNIMRYLQQEYRDPSQTTNLVKEPTGEGINYKNYVEAIFLYYLHRADDGCTPGQRLDKAVRMVARCAAQGARHVKAGRFVNADGNTQLYRTSRMPVLLEMTEDELPEYICNNYMIVQPDAGGRILVNAEEITAGERVREILQWLEEAFDGNTLVQQSLQIDRLGNQHIFYQHLDQRGYDTPEEREANAVQWDAVRKDSLYAQSMQFEWELSALLRELYGDDEDFMRIVTALENRLDTTKNNELLARFYHNPMSDALRVDEKNYARMGDAVYDEDIGATANAATDADDDDADGSADDAGSGSVTRSGMIALYTHYYKTILDDSDNIYSFRDLCEDFCSVIDPLLEESRYQPISVKNILDAYVLFTLYFYLLKSFDE